MAKVALLIGVGNYEHLDDLKPLVSAPKDVAAMQRILLNAQMGEFSEVIPLIDPDPMQMQEAIETLYRDRAKDDLVLLFFSGHGIKDDGGKLYFSTRVTRKTPKGELVKSTAVPARFVHEIMGNSRSRRQVMILDCCFSGAFDPALNAKDDGSLDVQGQLGAEGRVVLTSSSSTEYSFEQQGSDLSIYTRFLVEGIETGAADRDNDGKVSVRELHEYATKKVQEAAPKMNPKIIVLKDEGFDVVFAKAQITDPKLRYRKEAERYSIGGKISPAGRTLLNTLQVRLKLSLKEAIEIEDQVLQPFRERLENLQHYRSAFIAETERQYPLTQETLNVLKDLQELLGLREEDVAPIEQETILQITKKPSGYQQSLQRYEQELRRSVQAEYPLSSHGREELRNLQQSLMLEDEDVARIEEPILEQTEASYQEILRQKKNDRENHEQLQKSRTSNSELIGIRTANFLQGKQKLLVGGVGVIGAIVGLVLIVLSGIPNSSHAPQEKKSPGSTTVVPAKDPNAKSSVGHSQLVSSLAFSPDGKILTSGSWDSSVKVWNLLNGELTYNLPASSWSVLTVAISPDSKTLASGNGYGPTIESETLKLWNLETGKLIRSISASAKIRAVAFSSDGTTLISGAEDKTIKLWNVNDGQLLKTLSGHSEIVTSVAVSSDGKNLVSGSFDKTVKLWNLNTGELIRTFSGHAGAVTSVAIDPDDKLIVSGSSDKTIKTWDLSTGRLVRTFSGHLSPVTSVAVSPDGQSLVSGGGGYDSPDRAIRVWNLNTGELIHTLAGHSEEVTAVAISPDGKIIASGSRDARVKIWSLSTGKLLRSL